MLTLFSIPRAWRGHFGLIQRNAVASWTRLGPGVEVLLLGDDEGSAEAARALSVRHLPAIERSAEGTPLVSAAFARAEAAASHPLLAYVNADIVLLPGFRAAVEEVAAARERFLMIGRRTNLDLAEPIDFSPGWEERLARLAREKGQLDRSDAVDYFAFRKGLWPAIPDFAVGRTVWDNWLIFGARKRGAVVVDATDRVTIVHQNHDYSHHAQGAGGVWKGPEAARNLLLAEGLDHCFTLADATHRLGPGGLRRLLEPARLRRHFYTLDILHPALRPALSVLRAPLRALRRARHREVSS